MTKDLSARIDSLRLEGNAEEIVTRFVQYLKYERGKDEYSATALDCYLSFATVIKNYLLEHWLITQPYEYKRNSKRVYYLSLEYLIGRSLNNAILNLDLGKESLKALKQMGFKMQMLEDLEWDAGLGNGGLGRLAACFLDSMASLKIPAYGYGIRYEYGIFFQHIMNGEQHETPDNWLRYGSVWEIPRPQRLFPVHFGGNVEQSINSRGELRFIWHPQESIMAMAYDYLIPGYKNGYINTLRLWSAKSTRDFDLDLFNAGDYVQAVADKNHSEMISKVLYPKDDQLAGKELRLKQEYFFVSATLQDIMRRYQKKHTGWQSFSEKAAIQMNDTHPAIAVAELMRLFVDEKGLDWESAWQITRATLAYTNHTILPEALEKWPVDLLESVLPRHLQIIYEVNHRFLTDLKSNKQADDGTLRRVSIIEEEPQRSVRMANLAIIGSHSVNGVSALHSEILKNDLFNDFYRYFPKMFNNKTNGITPRRWLMLANPALSKLIDDTIGKSWRKDLLKLKKLNDYLNDGAFIQSLAEIKHKNKEEFAHYCHKQYGIKLNPDSIFDFQTKRLHEYKRQLLNALHILHLVLSLKENEYSCLLPHSFFFSGKAAPGYFMAKLIIRFICAIRDYIEQDSELSQYLNVVFLPNYRVSLAEKIMPAAEVSQQISTAGTEASGTGNMKYALNGALTVGTLDGANIEIREAVGAQNFFLFGNTVEDLEILKQRGYNPNELLQENPYLQRIIEFIQSGRLSPDNPQLFSPILDSLLLNDQYYLFADFEDYRQVMQNLNECYLDKKLWNRMAAANIANMGRFSSDETIKAYAKEIWELR